MQEVHPHALTNAERAGPTLEEFPDYLGCMCRIYLEESLKSAGEFTDALEDDLADAQKLLALGPREADDIRSEIVSKTYKCDAAPSLCMITCSLHTIDPEPLHKCRMSSSMQGLWCT